MKAEMLISPLLSDLWGQVEAGLIKALSVETANVDLSEVVERIKSSELGVLVAKREDTLFGVAIVDEVDGWIDCPMMWSSCLESLNAMFGALEVMAKGLGAKGVKWTTANDKGDIYAAKRGYRRRLVEYAKEM